MNMENKLYDSPKITSLQVQIEEGIAATSARINTGGPDAIPEITNWETESFTKDIEF